MTKFIQIIFLVALYLLSLESKAFAQDFDKVVIERQDKMKNIKKTVKAIKKALQSKKNTDKLKELTRNIQLSISQANELFKINTSNSDADTEALDKIWEANSKFQQYFNEFEKSALDLDLSLSSNNIADYKKQFKIVTKTCWACHKVYTD